MYTVACPAPFVLNQVMRSADFDLPLSQPGDLCFDKAGRLYVADSGNSRILVLDETGKQLESIDGFINGEEKDTFNTPEGVYVTSADHLLIADTENCRVVELDAARVLVRIITVEDAEITGKNTLFYPRKVTTDSAGRLFVVARGQVNGIMQFTAEGGFVSFVGSNRVVASPLELFWRQILTKKQREKTIQFIPLEYSNLYMDDRDFLYAVTQATDEEKKVKRLNPGGTDILNDTESLKRTTEVARLSCVCADEDGNFYCVDAQSGCVYVYQADGTMLYAFGGSELLEGNFTSPTAVRYHNDRLYVADSVSNSITVFAMTDFSKNIQEAGRCYQSGDYARSLLLYQQVLRRDANFTAAHVAIGRIYYQLEDYSAAMTAFKKGDYRGDDVIIGYGKAMEQKQRLWMQKNLPVLLPVLTGCVLAAGGLMWWYSRRRRRKNE